MKNIKSYFALVGFLIIVSSCKKESNQVTDKATLESKNLSKAIDKSKVLDLEHSIAKSLAKIYAGNHDFKKALKNLCLQQKYGDYYTRLSEIFTENSVQKLASSNQIESINSLVKQMKAANSGREPIVFIPSVENLDPKIIASNSIIKPNSNDDLKAINRLPPETDQIIYVFGDNGGQNNELYPGYTMDESGSLAYYGMISESFAWNNDVVVIGIEEESSYNPDDDINPALSNPIKALSQRNPTRLEIGGRINVTNIKEIESWVRGKLEMKYFVNSSSGTLIKERAFAKIRRADINNTWLNLNDPLGHWDPNTLGQYQYERWIEEDGGSPVTITQNIPAAVPGGPTYTISTTLKNDDQNCGLATVDYNDTFYSEVPLLPSAWTIYYISYMNFQRYSQYQQ